MIAGAGDRTQTVFRYGLMPRHARTFAPTARTGTGPRLVHDRVLQEWSARPTRKKPMKAINSTAVISGLLVLAVVAVTVRRAGPRQRQERLLIYGLTARHRLLATFCTSY